MAVELLSLVLSLKAQPLENPPGALPSWWGRAAHALLLRALAQEDAALAAELHDEPEVRPFTVSNLIGPARGGLNPQATYRLRFSAYSEAVCARLLNAVQPGGALAPGARVELEYLPFEVEGAALTAAEDPWAGQTDYSSLAAGRLVNPQPPDRRITLRLASPTAFKTQGLGLPMPLPELVFGSLLTRWNAFAPISFPPEARRFAAECLQVSRFELSSRPATMRDNGLRVGAVGTVTYTAVNADRYWLGVLHTLAAFAFYSGVGAATTAGMGQACQVMDARKG